MFESKAGSNSRLAFLSLPFPLKRATHTIKRRIINLPRRLAALTGRMLRAAPVVLFIAAHPTSARAQPKLQDSAVIARAGDVFITEKEFVERFELLPALYRHRKPQLNQAKLELLSSMIAEKLLAQEARDRRLDHDSLYLAAVDDIRRLLVRDELYREEVRAKVHVTRNEISEGMARANRQVLVSFLYTDQADNARFVRSQIRSVRDFDRLAMDFSMNVTRDTATVIFGDADPRIEEAAYRLRKGEISPVVRAGDGYYILRVSGVQLNGSFAGLAPDEQRQTVEDLLRARKERARLDGYVREVLKDKVGYSRPGPFMLLARSLQEVFRGKVDGQSRVPLTTAMAAELRKLCAASLADTAVVVGTAVWSVSDVIGRLAATGFDVDSASFESMPVHLNTQIKVWVQQELLAGEGLRRGLDRSAAVRKQLALWSTAFLADEMKLFLWRRVSVSEADVWSILRSNDKNVRGPEVQIRELRTTSARAMSEAMEQLRRGSSLEEIIRQHSADPEARQNGGVTPFFQITERSPLGEIASDMEVGERYGPLRVGDGYVYFELLAKRAASPPSDTTLAARRNDAEAEALRIKRKTMLVNFLAQVASKRGYDIYEDRLKALEVTSVPMMTYRLLGFGGKMFAVPFVPPEIDWMNVEPPATPVLP